MKKLSLLILSLLISMLSIAQQLEQISFSEGSTLTSLGFFVDRNVIVRVSDKGNILEWGTEVRSERGNYYAPQLQPYMGRVEYYGQEADSAFKGKIKSIGTCTFTYYGASEIASKAGKLKTIGNQWLDYYTNYDNAALNGKLRSCGNINLHLVNTFHLVLNWIFQRHNVDFRCIYLM